MDRTVRRRRQLLNMSFCNGNGCWGSIIQTLLAVTALAACYYDAESSSKRRPSFEQVLERRRRCSVKSSPP